MPLQPAAFTRSIRPLLKMYADFFSFHTVILVDNTIGKIEIYDEGANNGTTSAYVHNRTELYNTISAGPYGGSGVTNVTYDVIFTFHTCDRIALRWQQNEYTTADIGYGR